MENISNLIEKDKTINSEEYNKLYEEYKSLVKERDKAERKVILNMIREAENKREEASKEILKECERMKKELDYLMLMS